MSKTHLELPGWTIQQVADEILIVGPNGNGMHVANKGALANRVLFSLAQDVMSARQKQVQGPDGEAQVDFDRDSVLTFLRYDGAELATVGALTLKTALHSDAEVKSALTAAVTQWVASTEVGKRLWSYSGRDLNIGDLGGGDAFEDQDLQRLLRAHGVQYVSCLVSATADAIAYDEVLVNEHDLPTEHESE